MKKLFLCIALLMLLTLGSVVKVCAAEEQALDVSVYKQGLVLNGVKTDTTHMTYPLLYYKDVVYMPLTTEFGKKAGFKALWNDAEKVMRVTTLAPDSNATLAQGSPGATVKARISGYKISVNDTPVTFEGFPVLVSNDVTYVPLTWTFTSTVLHWDYTLHSYAGLILQTDGKKTAAEVLQSSNLKYYEALAAFIRTRNGGLSADQSLDIVRIIDDAAKKNGIDEKWIMAVCWQESNFNSGSVSEHGAVGMMQIMEQTGRNFGFTREQLLDPTTNINLGAKYLGGLSGKYQGDMHLAAIAYNQGSTRVDRGTYSPKFGDQIRDKYLKIDAFVQNYMGK